MEWETVKLGDVAVVKGGKRLPKGISLISIPNKHPYIRIRDIGQSKYIELNETFEYVDDETQKSIARYITNKGDILLSIVGTIGLVGIVGKSLDCANQTENCVKIKDLIEIDRDYLYYFLISDLGQNEIRLGTVGAVQAKLPLKNILNFNIPIPNFETQCRIASILSSFDDKIENNNRINKNLEAQAQALFKSWFVDESHSVKLSDVALNITDGVHNTVVDDPSGEYILLSCKNIVGGQLTLGQNERKINKTTFDKLRKRTKLSKGDILVSTVGTVGEIVMLSDEPKNIEFQRSVGIIKPNQTKASTYFIYSALKYKQEQLKHVAHGAVQQCIFIGDLKDFEIPYSSFEKIMQFDKVVLPLFDQISENQKENQRLATLRDTLLPKLMKGEIEL